MYSYLNIHAMAKKNKIDVNDDLAVSKASTSRAQHYASVEQIPSKEELRKILTPFAEWAWGSAETAQAVIDKYFKQNPHA